MGISYSSIASQMTSFYNSVKTDYDSKPDDNSDRKPYPKAPGHKWVEEFMSVYDSDSTAGSMSKPSVVLVSMKSLLDFDPPGCDKMGTVIANYWSAQITPGAPASCGGGVSVSNDAAKIGSAINGYMCGLGGNYPEATPYYNHLFKFIEDQVKSIVWTVVETGTGNGPCSYTVSVS